jgi:hypothetical protein
VSEWSVDDPMPEDVDVALERLDAETYTLMTLHAGEGHHLAVGGGRGQYVVYATFGDERFWTLVRREPATGTVLLNVGSQEGDYPAETVVSKDEARSAALAFLRTGQLDPTQHWRE